MPTLLILDTNVLITIARFFFKGLETERNGDLLDLLLRLAPRKRGAPRPRVNFGWALIEASWSRERGVDLRRRRELKYAAEQVLAWDSERIKREFSKKHPPAERDRHWPRRAPLSASSDPVHNPSAPLIAAYGTILFAMSLELQRSSWPKDGSREAIRKLVAWANDTLGVRTNYAITIAIDLLGGSPPRRARAKRLLKFGGNETGDELARKAWNAAWDMWLISVVDGFNLGLVTGIPAEPTALITEDIDPVYLRSASSVDHIVGHGRLRVPVNKVYHELAPGIDLEWFSDEISIDPEEEARRMRRGGEALVKAAVEATNALERELGVSQVTFVDD